MSCRYCEREDWKRGRCAWCGAPEPRRRSRALANDDDEQLAGELIRIFDPLGIFV